jgi:hypothetical protein
VTRLLITVSKGVREKWRHFAAFFLWLEWTARFSQKPKEIQALCYMGERNSYNLLLNIKNPAE